MVELEAQPQQQPALEDARRQVRVVGLATDGADGDVEVAGPRREELVDLVRRLVRLRGEQVAVDPVPAPASMAAGSVLPGPDALIRGVDWQTWARTAVPPAHGSQLSRRR